jgi:hypothetical protein
MLAIHVPANIGQLLWLIATVLASYAVNEVVAGPSACVTRVIVRATPTLTTCSKHM